MVSIGDSVAFGLCTKAMNHSLAFAGHEREIWHLRDLYSERKCVLLVGPVGIGKTALLQHMRQQLPMLLCEETSSLRRICDGLERQLGWTHYKMNAIERQKPPSAVSCAQR